MAVAFFLSRSFGNAEPNEEAPVFVLLAEGNEHVAMTTSLFLEAENFKVQLVSDGQAAIDAACEQLPDVILMDA